MAELEKLIATVKERARKPVGILAQMKQPDKVEWVRIELHYGDVRHETKKTDSLRATILVVQEWRTYEKRVGEPRLWANFDSVEEAMLAEEYSVQTLPGLEEVSVEYVWREGQWTPESDRACYPFTDVPKQMATQKRHEEEGTPCPFKVTHRYDPANPEELVEVK